MSRFVVLAEFWNVYDAAVAVTALESAGIPAINSDWHLFNLYPHLMMATTGPRVLVPEDQLEEAAQIMRPIYGPYETSAPYETSYPCPSCGNRTYRMRRWFLVIPLTWLMMQLGAPSGYGPLAFFRRKRFCWNCHHQHLPAPVEPITDEELGYDGHGPTVGEMAKRAFRRFMLLRKL